MRGLFSPKQKRRREGKLGKGCKISKFINNYYKILSIHPFSRPPSYHIMWMVYPVNIGCLNKGQKKESRNPRGSETAGQGRIQEPLTEPF